MKKCWYFFDSCACSTIVSLDGMGFCQDWKPGVQAVGFFVFTWDDRATQRIMFSSWICLRQAIPGRTRNGVSPQWLTLPAFLALIALSKKWVDYLKSNLLPPSSHSLSQKSDLFDWSCNTRFSLDQLQHALAMWHRKATLDNLAQNGNLNSFFCCARGAPHSSTFSSAHNSVVHARLSRWWAWSGAEES